MANSKNNDNKKNLLRELVLIGVSITLLVAIALGWFQLNSKVKVSDVFLQATGDNVKITLQQLNAPDDWREVPKIEIKDYLPSQNETYRLVITNASSVAYQSKIELNDFGVTQNVGDKPETTVKLEDMILLTEVNIDGSNTQYDKPLSALFRPDTRHITLADGIRIPANKSVSVIFTFQLHEEADNTYQHKSLSFRRLLVSSEVDKTAS